MTFLTMNSIENSGDDVLALTPTWFLNLLSHCLIDVYSKNSRAW